MLKWHSDVGSAIKWPKLRIETKLATSYCRRWDFGVEPLSDHDLKMEDLVGSCLVQEGVDDLLLGLGQENLLLVGALK